MSSASRRPSRYRTWGRGRALRWDQYDYKSDAVVHLTVCAASGTPFGSAELAHLVMQAVEFRCRKHAYTLYGFCLMPDHLHVLLSPADSGIPVETWLQRFKSYTAHEFTRLGGRPPLWQRSANDHVCREIETAQTVLEYIVNNPVRLGLVRGWREWRWTKVFIDL
jgi:REP element-mobilizing transposase RayT